MNSINTLLEFIKRVLIATGTQLFWLLGVVFIFGLLLYLLARFTRTTFVKTVGQKFDIFFTGWIGIPVHELGHAIFCIFFRHKITEIKLFRPNAQDGTLGYVNHSFNPQSTYQNIGNFFIGIGPIIFGAVALYAALYFLVPSASSVFSSIESQGDSVVRGLRGEFSGTFASLWQNSKSILANLFAGENLKSYKFWIFLYLAICISSHMELSPPDIKGAKGGLISIVVFLLIMNVIILGLEATGVSSYFGSWWKFVKIDSYASGINRWVGTFGALFAFATIISALTFALSYAVGTIYNLSTRKGFVNPFW